MKICVFCSANNQIAPAFFQLTEELGRWAAENGHVIVFGGVNQGLMECLAKAVKGAGGETVGVVPSIVEETGRTSQYNDRVLTCHNLSERKQLMLDTASVSSYIICWAFGMPLSPCSTTCNSVAWCVAVGATTSA